MEPNSVQHVSKWQVHWWQKDVLRTIVTKRIASPFLLRAPTLGYKQGSECSS